MRRPRAGEDLPRRQTREPLDVAAGRGGVDNRRQLIYLDLKKHE
jgi:hypothetical protein